MTKNNYIKRALFRLRWLSMSDRERCVYTVEADGR